MGANTTATPRIYGKTRKFWASSLGVRKDFILVPRGRERCVFEKNILCSFDLVRISRGVSHASVVVRGRGGVFMRSRVTNQLLRDLLLCNTHTHRLHRRVATFRGEQNCRQRYPDAKSYFSRSVCDCITFARISARAWND